MFAFCYWQILVKMSMSGRRRRRRRKRQIQVDKVEVSDWILLNGGKRFVTPVIKLLLIMDLS